MGLGSRDLAILSARFDVARFGASRFGFCPRDVEGSANDEPGEYVWKEDPPPTTTWTLSDHNCYCGDPPTASFTMDQDTGDAPLTVVFTDTSTGTVSHWYWEFGDGDTSQAQNPTHVYAAAGTYTVSLWVSGAGGSDGPAEDTVTVTEVTTGTITGTITYRDEVDVPWPAVTVDLLVTAGGEPDYTDSTTTAADGSYSFTSVPEGTATVTIQSQLTPALDYQGGYSQGSVIADQTVVIDVACLGLD